MATAATGALSVTLEELVRRLADEFGDYYALTATANGAVGGTTFIDTERVNTGTEVLTGSEIYVTSGTNDGVTRRITATTDTTGTLTFAAMTGQVLSGVTAEVYNKRGTGFLRAQYVRAINKAIDDAAGLALVVYLDSSAGTFDADTPDVSLDAQFREVFKVEYEDDNGDWLEVKKAPRWGGEGWTALAGQGKIRIMGMPAQLADGNTLQVWGYGRQDSLSADSDTSVLDPSWLLNQAKYRLAQGNLDRRPELGQMVMLFRQDAREAEGRLRLLRHPDAMAVR